MQEIGPAMQKDAGGNTEAPQGGDVNPQQ
jgi:hypothetical protein